RLKSFMSMAWRSARANLPAAPSIADWCDLAQVSALYDRGRRFVLKVRVFGFLVGKPDESDRVIQSVAHHDSPKIVPADDKQNAEQDRELAYNRHRPRALIDMNQPGSQCRGHNGDRSSSGNTEPRGQQRLDRPEYNASEGQLFENPTQRPRYQDARNQLRRGLLDRPKGPKSRGPGEPPRRQPVGHRAIRKHQRQPNSHQRNRGPRPAGHYKTQFFERYLAAG